MARLQDKNNLFICFQLCFKKTLLSPGKVAAQLYPKPVPLFQEFSNITYDSSKYIDHLHAVWEHQKNINLQF